MLQFSYIQEVDFSRGIDQSSNTTAIQPGSLEDAVNVDPSGASLEKRTGYEKLAGDVPVVLADLSTSGVTTTLTFPAVIQLAEVDTSSSLHLQGRLEYSGNNMVEIDLITAGFTRIDTYTLASNTTNFTIDLTAELGIPDYTSLVSIYDTVTGEIIYANVEIDTVSGELLLSYSLEQDLQVQFITSTCPNAYVTPTPLAMDAGTVTITSAEHGLGNNIIPIIYRVSGVNKLEMALPERFTIATTGDIEIDFLGAEGGDTCQVVLTECGTAIEGTAEGGSTSTTVIIPAAESHYMIAACYMDLLGEGNYDLVLPDTILYDEIQNQHRVTFTHGGELTNYKIVYVYGEVASNRCTIDNLVDVDGNPLPSGSPVRMLVTATGLNNEIISVPPTVNFIDKYEAADETIIASSGQLFRTYDPALVEVCDIRNRTEGDPDLTPRSTTVGPTFTKDIYARTQGCIVVASATGAGYLSVTSITNISGRNFLVTVAAPGHNIVDKLGASTDILSVVPTGSRITISGSRVALFNDSFLIADPTVVDADTLSFTINVPAARIGSRDNDNESGALAGIFTDLITFQSEALFAADDIVTLSPTADCVAISSSGDTLLVDSVEEKLTIYQGQRLGPTASKTSIVVPGFSGLVAGDIVTAGGVVTRVVSAHYGISSTELQFRDSVPLSNGTITITCPLRWEVIRPADTFLGIAPVSEAAQLRSVAGKGSLYISGGVKYDGDKVYTSGVPNFQMYNAIGIDESAGSQISVTTAQAAMTATGTNQITLTTKADADKFNELDKVLMRNATTCDSTNIYTITKIDTTGANAIITLNKTVDASLTIMSTFVAYRYFIRLSLLDRNGSLAVSSSLGSEDLLVRLTDSAAVHLSGTVYPEGIDPIDYENLYAEIFRARETETVATSFYKVGSVNLSSESLSFMFTDAVPDVVAETSANKDQVASPIPGDIGAVRSRLPKSAAFLTTINNQLVVGNYIGENKARLQFSGDYADLQGEDFTVTTTSGTHTFSVATAKFDISAVAQAGTKVTVTHATVGTELAVGEVILITRAAKSSVNNNPILVGWHTVVDDVLNDATHTTFNISETLTLPDTAITADLVLYRVVGKLPLAHDLTYAPLSGSAEANTSVESGLSLHLAQAINSILTPIGITAFGGKGQINYELSVVGNSLVSVGVPTVTGFTVYCNGRLGQTSAVASATRYGSRIALSVKGSPEVFDSLEVSNASGLPLVQDVNPEDGESVVMAIPFFATAAFGAAQQSNVLLIFKDHGAYLLDPQAKYVGSTDVFKQLDTSGYGCECPLSVINSQVGVFFANTTGIYLIDRQYKFTRIGDKVSKLIDSGVFTPNSSTAAVNDISGGKIMFTSGASTLVFHLPEGEGGAIGWTRYEGIPATMWAHRDNAAIFSATGYVGALTSTYADAGSAITSTILLRNIDAGMPTIKKVMRHATVIISADTDYSEGELSASMAVDFSNNFEAMDTCELVGTEAVYVDGLSDYIRPTMQMVSFSVPTVKAGWYQMKIVSSKLGAGFTLARVVFRVAGIRERADRQANETKQG